jgi:hypothetical protein
VTNKRQQILDMDMPKTNYCTWTRQLKNMPNISNPFGNMVQSRSIFLLCPIKAKRYQMNDVPVDQLLRISYSKGRYFMIFEVTIEDAKPMSIVKVEIEEFCQ